MLGLRKKVRVCQRRSPGSAGGQWATPRPNSKYTECERVVHCTQHLMAQDL